MNRKYNPWLSLAALILLVVFLLTTCTGCSSITYAEATYEKKTSMFITVETAIAWDVVYHKDTKVMYVVSDGIYNHGTFTLLVNDDGSPMLWEE